MYSGTLTVKSNGANMKAITFTLAASASASKWGSGNTASTGELAVNAPTVVWTGDAKEVTFNIAANTQISKLAINTEGGVTPPPAPTIEEITVAKAIELCNALADNAYSGTEYRIKGFVVGTPAIDKKTDGTFYGNAKFYMADEKNGTTTIYAYQIYGLANAKMDSETYLKDGDEVIVQSQLQKYVKNGTTTLELSKCYIYSLNGSTGISTVKANSKFEGKMYNMAGQVVDKSYKGLVIMNGRKVVLK